MANEESRKAATMTITTKATQRMKDLADGYFNKGYKLTMADRNAISRFKKKYPEILAEIWNEASGEW